MKTIALIPHYNHGTTLAAVCAALRAHDLPVLIIDDGSDTENRALARQCAAASRVYLHERPRNGGKGAALKDGIHWAAQNGYSHALQIDADGQHDLTDIPRFLATGQMFPDALICGRPQYGSDAPKSRLHGRKISNFWIRINTGSRDIPDGMCGYRLYPVARTEAIHRAHHIGNRMDYDIEILVWHHRHRTPMHWLATRVRYPADGRSHFRLWRDNLYISAMHARLLLSGIFWRLRHP